jgi:regulatory protein
VTTRRGRARSQRVHVPDASSPVSEQQPAERKSRKPSPEEELDPATKAREICLRQLSHGPRTAAQLTAAMGRKGIEEDVANEVLERFTDVGLIDDAAFAEAWVESRHTGRGLARRALAHELRSRGVDTGIIAVAVAELDPERELETARALATKRLAATRGLETPARFRRVASLLARKGYSESVAYRVIREALEAEGEDAPTLAD